MNIQRQKSILYTEMLTERGYFAALKQLVEQMYEENGNTKVVLFVTSQGGPVSLYFLTKIVSQAWKDTYIDSYIPVAAAFTGGSHVLHILLTGPVILTGTAVDDVDTRAEDRTIPSIYWLMPHASFSNDTVLVVTPSRNYTANDYKDLFADAGYAQGYEQFKITENELEVPAPNVPTHCIYGLGFPTPLSFVYGEGFPDERPQVVYGDGDSVVNKESLETCLRWTESGYPLNNTVFHGIASHDTSVTDIEVLQLIASIVGAPVDPIDGEPLHVVLYNNIVMSIRLAMHACTCIQ